ncbi:MAG: hypothetical protein LBV40_07600 [Methanomicrobiales archaeon]|jgi:hypothetical protein|nr:hypothetical protein [Methanomicrobiales archaeon]
MKTCEFIFIGMLFGMLFAAPTLAAVYEPTWKGTVTAIDDDTISVEIESSYECDFTEAEPSCGFNEIDFEISEIVSSNIQDVSVYDVVEVGDPIIGKSYGGFESTEWSAFAPIIEEEDGSISIKALFGDVGLLDIAPLAADYVVSYDDMTADCEACTGTVCQATSVVVSISSEGSEVISETLIPGQEISYFEREDGSGIAVTFLSGETSYLDCETETDMGITGPQPIQNVSIIVTLPTLLEAAA